MQTQTKKSNINILWILFVTSVIWLFFSFGVTSCCDSPQKPNQKKVGNFIVSLESGGYLKIKNLNEKPFLYINGQNLSEAMDYKNLERTKSDTVSIKILRMDKNNKYAIFLFQEKKGGLMLIVDAIITYSTFTEKLSIVPLWGI